MLGPAWDWPGSSYSKYFRCFWGTRQAWLLREPQRGAQSRADGVWVGLLSPRGAMFWSFEGRSDTLGGKEEPQLPFSAALVFVVLK